MRAHDPANDTEEHGMGARDITTFGADTTADEVLVGLDLSGKVALVTGATSGLGYASARALSKAGARVIITARSKEKGQAAAEALAEETGGVVEAVALELGSLASVRACAAELIAREERVDLLLLNAGVMACPKGETADGFELQFGVNHLGHFTLTGLLEPGLNDGGRIVAVSSAAHRFSPIVFDDIQFASRDYDRWASYGQSKTANVLFAVELQRRLAHRNIEAFSLHPGVIQTELGRHLTEEDVAMFSQAAASGMKMKTIEAGASTQVFALTAPELAGRGGGYLSDCAFCEVVEADGGRDVVHAYALDPEVAKRLWSVSEDLVGQTFAFG